MVEGSTLSEQEARDVLAGRTVSGHPAHEARELINYRSATAWLLEQLEQVPWLSQDLVLGFHARLLSGLSEEAGRFKIQPNYTLRSDGTRHDYLAPAGAPDAMREWLELFNAEPAGEAHLGAARLYADFQQLHPFQDGNGRIGRLLIAYWLHFRHGLAFRFFAADRLDHLRAIEATDTGDLAPLASFIRARILKEE